MLNFEDRNVQVLIFAYTHSAERTYGTAPAVAIEKILIESKTPYTPDQLENLSQAYVTYMLEEYPRLKLQPK